MNLTKQAERQSARDSQRKPLLQFFYVYSAEVLGIATTLNGSDTIQIQADSTFMLQAITGTITDTTAAPDAILTAPLVKVQITDTGSGANLFDEPQQWQSIVGTAQLPFLLPVSRIMMPNSALQVTVYNNTAVTINANLSLIGQKLYESSK